MAVRSDTGLQRVLGRRDLLALAWGCMIGWGWVILSAGMAERAGPVGSALAFLCGGVVIALVGLVYADFTARIPRAGGELAFCFAGLGPKRSAACGWILCLAYVAVCAFEAVALPRVLYQLFPGLESRALYHVAGAPVSLASVLIGSAGVLGISLVNALGIRPASLLQVAGGAILALAGATLFTGAAVGGEIANLSPRFVSWSGFFSVIIMTPFLMLGFDVIPQVAEETRAPSKHVAGVILFAIALAGLWYAAVQLSIGALLPESARNTAELAPVEAMEGLWGTGAGRLILVGGVFGIVTSWNACFVGAVRLVFAMGRGRMLSASMGQLHHRFATPTFAILFLTIISLCAPWLGRRALVWFVNAGAFATVVAYFLVACAYRRVRRRGIAEERSLSMARPRFLPGLAILVTFAFTLLYVPGSPVALAWPWEWGILLVWGTLGLLMCAPRMAASRFDRAAAEKSILGEDPAGRPEVGR